MEKNKKLNDDLMKFCLKNYHLLSLSLLEELTESSFGFRYNKVLTSEIKEDGFLN